MRIRLSNLLFFAAIGFTADLFNFAAAQAEILTGTFVFRASGLQLGVLGACSSIFYAAPTMFTGLLSERTGPRPLVLLAICGMACSYFWGAHVGSMGELYGVVILRALSTAFLWPSTMAWMARAVPPRNFSRFLGGYNVSWASGTFIGYWICGYLFEKLGWTSPFMMAGILACLLFVFVLFSAPHGGNGIVVLQEADSQGDHGVDEEQAKSFVRIGLLMVWSGMIASASCLFIFPKLAQGVITEQQISFLNSIRLLGQMVAFFLMGRYSGWHFRKWPVWGMAGVSGVGVLLAATGQVYLQFMAGFLLVGMGFGAAYTMCAYYSLGLSRNKGKGSGIMETTIGVGGLTGSMLGGVVTSVSTPRAGLLSGLVPAVVLAWMAARRWVRVGDRDGR